LLHELQGGRGGGEDLGEGSNVEDGLRRHGLGRREPEVAESLAQNHLALVADDNDGTGRFTRADGFFYRCGDGSQRLRQEGGDCGRSAQQGGRGRQ
jgi:hypothetical protein